ncbi:parathyroid hormone/parathyroid hormone-related peptide receptor-like isoform X2 [Ornithodoros turicata]|uniref:parathyroid hormone/parathyroid hormone-related peptide receptor-like isoform X2 n=1 Tax=Ornithodoros turicata TaxID=34597 RepID=UPI003138A9F8
MLPTLNDAMRSCMDGNASASHWNALESNQDALSRGTNVSELFCGRIWDGILCWGPVPANTTVYAGCPEYPYDFDTSRTASKFCTETGSWYYDPVLRQPWTNYSLCILGRGSAIHSENITFFEPHLGTIKMMSKVGYTVSLISLVIALTILISVKKLRCPRNSLHVHLFLSFIFRALAVLVKDAIFVEGIGLSTNLDFTQNNVDCKVFTSIWHYVLMANYCWILMEGLYLHNLIFLAFFTDSSGIIKYVVLGWGLPVVFLIPWIIVRATLEDTLCWTTNETQIYFWIIRGPITVSILVNFVMFINVTRVLLAKLFTPQACEARRYRYRKWFKSTLVLVPLFGAHYAFLLGMSLAAAGNLLELVWLYIDQLFSSFQGFLVATLYCFLNTEVGTQARKALVPGRFSWRRVRPAPSNGPRHLSVLTQSFTLVTRVSPANHTLPHKDVAAHI